MRAAIFDDPTLQQCMGNLFQALIDTAPERQSIIHLLVETRNANRKTSILFTIGSPQQPGEYSTLVPDPVSNAAFPVMNLLLQQDERAPGFEVVLSKTGS